jgi:AcrR family transcriptional regulator
VPGIGLVMFIAPLRCASAPGAAQEDLQPRGHAIEARIYAEDPGRGNLPTGGVVRVLHEPDDLPDVRVDSSLLPGTGTGIGSWYDPMLSKIIAWGPDRESARQRLDAALAHSCILGVTTNTAFLRTVLADGHVIAGALDTGLIERIAAALPAPALFRAVAVVAAAALLPRLTLHPRAGAVDDPWADARGWRLGPPAWSSWKALGPDGAPVEVAIRSCPFAVPARSGLRPSRRDELLASSAELFAAAGFFGVTMDDIAAAAGISGPALYHHFDSKEALLGEMLVRISEQLLAAGEDIRETVSPDGRLEALVAMHVEFAVDHRPLIAVQLRDLVNARETDRRRVHELQGAYVDIWVAALLQRRPSIGPRIARAALHSTFGLLNSTPISGHLRRDLMVELLERMALGALATVVDSPLGE